MKQRVLNIIQNEGVPIAALMETFNTEHYSAFGDYHLFHRVIEGAVVIYDQSSKLQIREGECFFIGKYANYKVQRYLGANGTFKCSCFIVRTSKLNQAIGQVLPVPSSFEMDELMKRTERQFEHGVGLSKNELEQLDRLSECVLEQIRFCEQPDLFLQFLYQNLTSNLTVKELATRYGKSTASFSRLFASRMGVSVHKWIREQRLYFAKFTMQNTQKPVSQIYLDMGFENLAHFSKVFKKQFGYNPSTTYGQVAINVIG